MEAKDEVGMHNMQASTRVSICVISVIYPISHSRIRLTSFRIRKIKCDEAKPHCKRCTSTGRKCDGYALSPPSAQTYEIVYTPRVSPLASLKATFHFETREEQEAFHFYQCHAAAELAGCLDATFWEVEIPRLCSVVPAVRHAVIGLATMHRKFIVGTAPVVPEDYTDKQVRLALHHANRAIHEIAWGPTTKSIKNKINIMAICILFKCIASMQGHQVTALQHLRNGLRILREVDAQMDTEHIDIGHHAVSLDTLRSLFLNMDGQVLRILSDQHMDSWEPQPKRYLATLDMSIKTIAQARYYIEATFIDMLAYGRDTDLRPPKTQEELDALREEFRRLRQQFEKCTTLLNKFLADPSTSPDDEAVLRIQIIHTQANAFIKTFKEYDPFKGREILHIDEEDHILLTNLVARLLKAPSDLTLPDGNPADYFGTKATKSITVLAPPSFSSGSGMLASLWLVTSRTRDPVLRRRAIGMLLYYPRREGAWDSVLAARLAWEIMLLEEAGSDGDFYVEAQRARTIKDCNRIRDVDIRYTGLRTASVEFRTVAEYEAGTSGVVRHLAW
jgi:hypothetical protein